MRIAGTNVPSEKRLIIALTYIAGVGPKRSVLLCDKSKLDPNTRVKDLTGDQEEVVREALASFDWVLESDLKREVQQNVKRLQEIGSYRGFRHRRGLPVRGQQTKTNARTKRGKKKTMAGKKKVMK